MASSESCRRLSVCPSAPLLAGGEQAWWAPSREACARVRSVGALRGRPSGTVSNSEWLSFCHGPCSAEGRAVSGPGWRPSASPRLWASLPQAQAAGTGSTPFHAHPASPCTWGGEYTLLHSRNCKIKFPRCSGPRSSCVLSGEEVGIGKSCAVFSPCSPCFSGATTHSRSCKSQPASVPARGPVSQPPSLLPASCLRAPGPHQF